jgi:hypothetical protein
MIEGKVPRLRQIGARSRSAGPRPDGWSSIQATAPGLLYPREMSDSEMLQFDKAQERSSVG